MDRPPSGSLHGVEFLNEEQATCLEQTDGAARSFCPLCSLSTIGENGLELSL